MRRVNKSFSEIRAVQTAHQHAHRIKNEIHQLQEKLSSLQFSFQQPKSADIVEYSIGVIEGLTQYHTQEEKIDGDIRAFSYQHSLLKQEPIKAFANRCSGKLKKLNCDAIELCLNVLNFCDKKKEKIIYHQLSTASAKQDAKILFQITKNIGTFRKIHNEVQERLSKEREAGEILEIHRLSYR